MYYHYYFLSNNWEETYFNVKKKNFFRIPDYYFEEVFVGCQLTTKKNQNIYCIILSTHYGFISFLLFLAGSIKGFQRCL